MTGGGGRTGRPGGGGRGSEHRDRSGGSSGLSQPVRPGAGQRQGPLRERSDGPVVPGEVLYGGEPVEINTGKDVVTLRVENTADRAVQVGSHYHFAEVNPGLAFDRSRAWGRRLNILSGGSMRFEPGAAEEVELIPIGGNRIVAGLRGECGGGLDG